MYQFGWYNFEKLEELYSSLSDETELKNTFFEQGKNLINIENKDVSYAVTKSVLTKFQGYNVRVTSCSHLIRSEVGSALCDRGDCDFSMTWRYDFEADQWWISLRGAKTCSVALNILCEKYEGGGHQRACGFAIHGARSKEWHCASVELRERMAFGNLHDYFLIE